MNNQKEHSFTVTADFCNGNSDISIEITGLPPIAEINAGVLSEHINVAKTWVGLLGDFPEVFAFNSNRCILFYSKDHQKSQRGRVVYNYVHSQPMIGAQVLQSMNEVFVIPSDKTANRFLATNPGGEFSIELTKPSWVTE